MRDDFTPYCETADGCPLGDVALDPHVNELAMDFIKRRSLYELTKAESTYQALVTEYELADHLDVHLELEDIWQRWHQSIKKNSAE